MKLTTKLTVLFLLLSVVPMSIVGYLAYANSRQTIKEDTLNHLVSTTRLKENEFKRWLSANKQQLRELARRPLIRKFAHDLSSYSPNTLHYKTAYDSLVEDHLNPTLEEEGGFLNLSILHRDNGFILISTAEKLERKFRENDPFFKNGRQHTYVGDIRYSLTLEQFVMPISTPINDKKGNLIAVLSGHLDWSEITDIMMQASSLSASEETYLVNKFNFFVTESRFKPGFPMKQAIYTKGVKACLDHNNGVDLYTDYRGVAIIGAYRWIPENEMCIITEVDQVEAFAPIVSLRTLVFRIGYGVAVIISLLGILFSRTITRPLHKLVKGVEAIVQGDLNHRIEIKTKDEIGKLGLAFNRMTAQLSRELDERKLAKEALRKSEAKYRSLIKNIPSVVYIGNKDWSVEFIDQKIELLTGYDVEEFNSGRLKWSDIIVEEDIETVRRSFIQALKTDKPFVREYRIKSKDGDIRWLQERGRNVCDNKGIVEHISGVFFDITEAKLIQKQLMQSEKLVSVGELAAGVAHEINNPINGVINYAQILIDKTEGQPDEFTIPERILKEAERVAGIVKNLLTFARETDDMPGQTSVQAIVSDTLELVEKRLNNDGIQVHLAIPDELAIVNVNSQKMQQVFMNLLSNAQYALNRKYRGFHQEKAVRIEGEIKDVDGKRYSRVIIHDNGMGIPPGDIDRVCDPFFSTKPQGEGTGLGLSISYGIVKDQGGHLSFESKEGEYTMAIVDLPAIENV